MKGVHVKVVTGDLLNYVCDGLAISVGRDFAMNGMFAAFYFLLYILFKSKINVLTTRVVPGV